MFGQKHYYDKNLHRTSEEAWCGRFNLAHAYRLVKDEDLNPESFDIHGREKYRLPFVRFNVAMNERKRRGFIGSIKNYNTISFGILEFFINFESTIVSNNLKFFMNITDLLG